MMQLFKNSVFAKIWPFCERKANHILGGTVFYNSKLQQAIVHELHKMKKITIGYRVDIENIKKEVFTKNYLPVYSGKVTMVPRHGNEKPEQIYTLYYAHDREADYFDIIRLQMIDA